LPLRQDGRMVGTLDLFRRHPGGLRPGDAALAQALADVATATIVSQRSARDSEVVNQQLQTALTSRVVIEQAKGMLSQRHGLTLETAFQQMRGYARRRNLRVRDVARDVINGDDRIKIENGSSR
jgi:AmiR/NasT family two-component response regulator